MYALSDWSAETFPYARRLATELDLFDDIQISGVVRLTKPDPRVFALAAERFGVDPRTTFFTDDIAANVEGAREAGFTAFLFTSAAELRKELVTAGVLVS